MGLFNLSAIKDTEKNEIKGFYETYSVLEAMDQKLFRDLVDKMADRITDDIYDEVIKKIDKDTIVREVSLKVSENILTKLFGSRE